MRVNSMFVRNSLAKPPLQVTRVPRNSLAGGAGFVALCIHLLPATASEFQDAAASHQRSPARARHGSSDLRRWRPIFRRIHRPRFSPAMSYMAAMSSGDLRRIARPINEVAGLFVGLCTPAAACATTTFKSPFDPTPRGADLVVRREMEQGDRYHCGRCAFFWSVRRTSVSSRATSMLEALTLHWTLHRHVPRGTTPRMFPHDKERIHDDWRRAPSPCAQ